MDRFNGGLDQEDGRPVNKRPVSCNAFVLFTNRMHMESCSRTVKSFKRDMITLTMTQRNKSNNVFYTNLQPCDLLLDFNLEGKSVDVGGIRGVSNNELMCARCGIPLCFVGLPSS